MSRHAFILGGTGQIGREVALDLLARGWSVTVAHRGTREVPEGLLAHGAEAVVLDRDNTADLARVLGSGADVLIDTIAYHLGHAQQLTRVQGSVGSLVVVSSASVYRDNMGRTLDEAMQNGFPELPEPVPETHPTVDPGPQTYSTRKVALERHLLDEAACPVTILRPCAVYGSGSRHPREWWFVKRILDHRPAIPLAYRGTSRFHTSAVANIAALTRIAIETPGSRVLNIADAIAPSVAQIAASIAKHLNYNGRLVELTDPTYPPPLGKTPWSVPRPFVLDCRAAVGLGYSPATSYCAGVKGVCDWLVLTEGQGDWKERFPVLASYKWDLFDYAREDELLGTQS